MSFNLYKLKSVPSYKIWVVIVLLSGIVFKINEIIQVRSLVCVNAYLMLVTYILNSLDSILLELPFEEGVTILTILQMGKLKFRGEKH